MKRCAIGLAFCLAASTVASAQTPPATIKVIVPNGPGGAMDLLIRVLGDFIARAHGATVIVDNRPGASTIIGTDLVARARPDGGTLLMAANSFLVNPHIRSLPFDPLTSFVGLCQLVEIPQVVAVNARSPSTTLADLIAAAKARPGKLTIGSNGPATAQHLVAEAFRRGAGLDMVYVPYSGGTPAVNALMGEQIDAMTTAFSDVHAQWEAGVVRVLASSMARRTPLAPNIPTFRESGLDFDLPSWLGILAPAQTPAPVVATLDGWFGEALAAPEVRARLASMQMAGVERCGAPYAAFLHEQYDVLGRIVRDAGIKAR